MHQIKTGFFCICLLLCSTLSAKAAEDVGPEAQKRMSIVLSQLTRNLLTSVQPNIFLDPKTPNELLYFAGHYVEKIHSKGKARLAPALHKSGGSAPLGERLVTLEAVKTTIKRFFDYDLPAMAPGQYGSVHFDGKEFHLRMSGGAPAYWAQVKEAQALSTGNIAVKGVLRRPEDQEVATFTAELKPILWKSMKTYAVISLTTTQKGK